jgi:hypothetical protein
VCLEALAEKGCSGQWTVDDLDGGGGLMANKNKSIASESNGNVFVGTIPSLGHSWGERGKFMVRKLNY